MILSSNILIFEYMNWYLVTIKLRLEQKPISRVRYCGMSRRQSRIASWWWQEQTPGLRQFYAGWFPSNSSPLPSRVGRNVNKTLGINSCLLYPPSGHWRLAKLHLRYGHLQPRFLTELHLSFCLVASGLSQLFSTLLLSWYILDPSPAHPIC